MEVREYQAVDGKTPVAQWLSDLRDSAARARIVSRLDRLKAGILGDWKSVGEGVCELRIDYVTRRTVRRSSSSGAVATNDHKQRISN